MSSAAIYLFKVSNGNTRAMCEICSQLTVKTAERHFTHYSGVSIVNSEQVNAGWAQANVLCLIFTETNFCVPFSPNLNPPVVFQKMHLLKRGWNPDFLRHKSHQNFTEIPQVVQKIWSLCQYELFSAIFIKFLDFLVFACYIETN